MSMLDANRLKCFTSSSESNSIRNAGSKPRRMTPVRRLTVSSLWPSKGILVCLHAVDCLKGEALALDDASVSSTAELFDKHAGACAEASFPHGLTDVFVLVQLNFLRAIDGPRDPEGIGTEGLFDLAGAYAICESATHGRPVNLDEVLGGSVAECQADIDRHSGSPDASRADITRS
jgi:hypothetical protein